MMGSSLSCQLTIPWMNPRVVDRGSAKAGFGGRAVTAHRYTARRVPTDRSVRTQSPPSTWRSMVTVIFPGVAQSYDLSLIHI